MRERMRFSLRGLFVLVAAAAVLFSQYPFIESREIGFISPQVISTVTIEYRLVERPTRGFLAVATIELALALCWICWRMKGRGTSGYTDGMGEKPGKPGWTTAGCLAGTILFVLSYVGSYLLMLAPPHPTQGFETVLLPNGKLRFVLHDEYRFGSPAVWAIYWPINQVDRAMRPTKWRVSM
jgi:hypothetical protein